MQKKRLGKKVILFLVLGLFLASDLSFSLSEVQSGSPAISPVISMDFQDANLKDVLKVFSQQANLNFIASENVKDRRVTLYLDRVSVQDALNTLMGANNLTYQQEKESRIFVVKEWGRPEVETITKVFPLQYARVKGYELTTGGEQKQESKEIGLKEIIEKLVSEHGRVIEDSRTNSLIVTDVPSQFPKIEQAIKELDVKLPQVMIEAEIIEASLETIDKLGIEWGTTNEGELVSAFGAAQSVKYPFTKDSSMPRIGQDGRPIKLYTGYISAMNLGGTLAMLAKDTDTKILARPRILTLNNETAEIKITAETAISSQIQEVRTDQNLGQAITRPERVETGVSLKVTPQINQHGEVTMAIEPAVISTKSSKYFTNFVDPQTRSAKTTVTMKDGQTIIIGGLIDTEDSKIFRKVPFFGDVPLLGKLFSKKNDSTTDKELIIFITPHLVKDGAKTEARLSESKKPQTAESFGRLKEQAMERMLDKFEE